MSDRNIRRESSRIRARANARNHPVLTSCRYGATWGLLMGISLFVLFGESVLIIPISVLVGLATFGPAMVYLLGRGDSSK